MPVVEPNAPLTPERVTETRVRPWVLLMGSDRPPFISLDNYTLMTHGCTPHGNSLPVRSSESPTYYFGEASDDSDGESMPELECVDDDDDNTPWSTPEIPPPDGNSLPVRSSEYVSESPTYCALC